MSLIKNRSLISVSLLAAYSSLAVADQAHHKIIYMITLARSTSTAFLRMMHERDDFTVLHEPGGCAYNVTAAPHIVDQVFRADAPRTFEAVHQFINQNSTEGHVFVKEMRPVAETFLGANPEFVADARVQFVFLVRNPHDMLVSNYLVRKNAPPLAPEIIQERLSYEALYKLFQKIAAASVNPPIIILSEDFCLHPTEVIQAFCAQVEIPFIPDTLSWESREGKFDVREWNGITNGKNANNWHGEAIRSTGIHEPRKYARDAHGEPTFEEIDTEAWRQFYRELYNENLPYHQLFLDKFEALHNDL
jgi:hypothetical protein